MEKDNDLNIKEQEFVAKILASSGNYLDEDGYPTQDALSIIESWPPSNITCWFDFVFKIWTSPEWAWSTTVKQHRYRSTNVREYKISTTGWSGNESIIEAMQRNYLLWSTTWYESRRGGHYTFEVELLDGQNL